MYHTFARGGGRRSLTICMKEDRHLTVSYRKSYCDAVIEFFSAMRRGEKGEIVGVPSFLSFAEKLGVPITRLEKWRREHPEFDEACEHASELFRQLLMDAALNGTVNVSAAKFILSAEFGMLPSGEGRGKSREEALDESDRRLLRNLEERLFGESVKA